MSAGDMTGSRGARTADHLRFGVLASSSGADIDEDTAARPPTNALKPRSLMMNDADVLLGKAGGTQNGAGVFAPASCSNPRKSRDHRADRGAGSCCGAVRVPLVGGKPQAAVTRGRTMRDAGTLRPRPVLKAFRVGHRSLVSNHLLQTREVAETWSTRFLITFSGVRRCACRITGNRFGRKARSTRSSSNGFRLAVCDGLKPVPITVQASRGMRRQRGEFARQRQSEQRLRRCLE